MIEGKFSEEDRDNFVKFLNFIHSKAEFKISAQEAVQYTKLLNQMQTSLLSKIEKNILEVIEVINKEE